MPYTAAQHAAADVLSAAEAAVTDRLDALAGALDRRDRAHGTPAHHTLCAAVAEHIAAAAAAATARTHARRAYLDAWPGTLPPPPWRVRLAALMQTRVTFSPDAPALPLHPDPNPDNPTPGTRHL